MQEEWMLGAALAVLCLDACLFTAVVFMVRKGMLTASAKITEVLSEPEARRQLGEGFARGMRLSANGREGQEVGATKAQERNLMATALKDWMGHNTPLVRTLMDQFPETWKLVQKQPELGFLIMSKWGPRLEAQAQAAMDRAAGAAGLNEQ